MEELIAAKMIDSFLTALSIYDSKVIGMKIFEMLRLVPRLLHGPCFGFGDLWIDLGNLPNSYSSLGHSYQLPENLSGKDTRHNYLVRKNTPWWIKNVEVYTLCKQTTVYYESNLIALNKLICACSANNLQTRAKVLSLLRKCIEYDKKKDNPGYGFGLYKLWNKNGETKKDFYKKKRGEKKFKRKSKS